MAKRVLHGKKHKWKLHGDFVDKRDARGIKIVEREEHCNDCPRNRYRKWDVRKWIKLGVYRYSGKVIPMEDRISDADAVRDEFLATTTLTELKEQEAA
jgi:hypothetical protein